MKITLNQLLTPTEKITNARLNQLLDITLEIEDEEVVRAMLAAGAVGKNQINLDELEDHADDSEAEADGVPVGGLYRTGSAVKVRVS